MIEHRTTFTENRMDLLTIFLAAKLPIVIVVIALLAFLCADYKQKRGLVNVSVIILPLAFVMSRIANLLIENPRPFVDGHMSALIYHIPDNGFPSDHTLLAVTIGAIVYTQNKVIGSILIGLGILVGVGRVLAGVHHAIDITGSVIIAFVSTYIISILILRR